MKKKDNGTIPTLLTELQDIKKLLILALIYDGCSQAEIAHALNVNQSSVSRMFPKGINQLTRQKA